MAPSRVGSRSGLRALRRQAATRLQAARATARDALGLPPTEPLARIIYEFARAHSNAFVIQIGSHDSSQLDPIRRYIETKGWRGVLVEPIPEVFERLKANYAHIEGLVFENAAIGPREGVTELHYVPQTDEEGLPPWYDALASFRKDVLLSHRRFIPDIEDRIRSMDVACMTFDSLCAKHGITRADFIQIDTEGYDYEIVKIIDLDRYQPALLQVEELHFDEPTRRLFLDRVSRSGYQAIGNGMDCLCLHPGRVGANGARLMSLWRRFRSSRGGALLRT